MRTQVRGAKQRGLEPDACCLRLSRIGGDDPSSSSSTCQRDLLIALPKIGLDFRDYITSVAGAQFKYIVEPHLLFHMLATHFPDRVKTTLGARVDGDLVFKFWDSVQLCTGS